MVQGEKLREWKKGNLYRLSVDLNRNNENDRKIIERLETLPKGQRSAYIKWLVLRDVHGESER